RSSWQALPQERHRQDVLVVPVDQEGVAANALDLEAEAPVERDRVAVVLANGELDAGELARPRRGDRLLHQARADAVPAKLGHQRDSEDAAVLRRVAGDAGDIAPADHLLAGEGDELRISTLDVSTD